MTREMETQHHGCPYVSIFFLSFFYFIFVFSIPFSTRTSGFSDRVGRCLRHPRQVHRHSTVSAVQRLANFDLGRCLLVHASIQCGLFSTILAHLPFVACRLYYSSSQRKFTILERKQARARSLSFRLFQLGHTSHWHKLRLTHATPPPTTTSTARSAIDDVSLSGTSVDTFIAAVAPCLSFIFSKYLSPFLCSYQFH